MKHTAWMERSIRAEQLELEEWITVPEAARRLGTTESCVKYNMAILEGTKVGHRVLERKRLRWVVKASKVEWLKRVRAGEVKVVKPPEVEEFPNEIDSELRIADCGMRNGDAAGPVKELTGTEYLRRVWVDYDANDTWVTADQAASVLGVTI